MRTGKLTEPDVNVDVDLMERRFHEWLKKTGAVSGRKLTTDQDYSREFVEIENSVGKAIDRGIDIINGYHEDGRDGNQSKFPALSARLQANLDFPCQSRAYWKPSRRNRRPSAPDSISRWAEGGDLP